MKRSQLARMKAFIIVLREITLLPAFAFFHSLRRSAPLIHINVQPMVAYWGLNLKESARRGESVWLLVGDIARKTVWFQSSPYLLFVVYRFCLPVKSVDDQQ